MEKGRCTRGNTCPFAHGEAELGKLNPRVRLGKVVCPLHFIHCNHVWQRGKVAAYMTKKVSSSSSVQLTCSRSHTHGLAQIPHLQEIPHLQVIHFIVKPASVRSGYSKCLAGTEPNVPCRHVFVSLPLVFAQAAVLLTHWNDHPPPGPGPHVRALAVKPHPTADDAKKYKRRICTFWEEVSRVPNSRFVHCST